MKGFLKCSCQHCGGHIEFPGSAIDSVVACPHCGESTTLHLDDFELEGEPESESSPWKKLIITTVVLVVLTAITIGAYYFVKSKATKKGLIKPTSNITEPAPKTGSTTGTKNVAGKSESVPDSPSAPEHVFDADPAKHRFPVEAARRAPVAGDIKTGREVYLGHCSECHVFYDPASYPGSQWPTILGKMEGKAKLGRDERDRLERFTQSLRAPGT